MFRLHSHFGGQLFLGNNTTLYKFPSRLLILGLQLKAIALIKGSCGLLCGTRHILFVEKPNKKNDITNQYLQQWDGQRCLRGGNL